MKQSIEQEIDYLEKKVTEYNKDYESNLGGNADYFKGKRDAYKYASTRLKRILENHNTTTSKPCNIPCCKNKATNEVIVESEFYCNEHFNKKTVN